MNSIQTTQPVWKQCRVQDAIGEMLDFSTRIIVNGITLCCSHETQTTSRIEKNILQEFDNLIKSDR